MGHPRACCSKWATHDAQNRRCPHGTNASRASRCAMRHTSHLSCDGSALTGNLVLFLVDSCIPARQWTDVCNTRCSILSRFSHFHVSHFPPLQHGAAFSCPAISCLAFSAPPSHCFNPVRQVALAYRQSAIVSRSVQRRQWDVLLQKVPVEIYRITVIFGVLSFRSHDFLVQFDNTTRTP